MSLPVAVLAGGLATRLRPLTERVPKILLDIAGRPFAVHQIELLRRQGIRRVVYCLGYLGEQVAETLGDGSRWQMTFDYVFDGPRPLGTGGALQRALPKLDEAFFVMYGDSYLECDFKAVERSFREAHRTGKLGLMTVFRNENRYDRSNVTYDPGRRGSPGEVGRSGTIVRYDKVSPEGMQHIDYGLGILTPEAFDLVANGPERTPGATDFPFDLAVVYQRLIERDALAGYEVHERFYEIGSPEGLEELQSKLGACARKTP